MLIPNNLSLDSGTGGILLWRLSANPATATFGSRSAEDAAYEKEAWQAIKMIKSVFQALQCCFD